MTEGFENLITVQVSQAWNLMWVTSGLNSTAHDPEVPEFEFHEAPIPTSIVNR